jgi:hypothetical protein
VATGRVRPVDQPTFADTTEDLVEPVLVDQERIVLGMHRAVVVGEVEGHVVVDLDDQEGAERHRSTHGEDLGKECRRLALVSHRHDRVVQLDPHVVRPP